MTEIPEPALFFDRDAQFAVTIGNHYFNVDRSGRYDINRAEKYFLIALRRDPQVPDAWHQLARIDFLRGNFPTALAKINKQIAIHGDSFMASFYIRGLIEGFSEDYKSAEADFLKFLSWDPTNWAAHNDLAWIYFSTGEYTKAEDIARRGLEHNLGNAWLLNSLGVALLNQGKKQEAHDVLLEARAAAAALTEAVWGRSYPGNNPQTYGVGLKKMKEAIEKNIGLSGEQ